MLRFPPRLSSSLKSYAILDDIVSGGTADDSALYQPVDFVILKSLWLGATHLLMFVPSAHLKLSHDQFTRWQRMCCLVRPLQIFRWILLEESRGHNLGAGP